jgi:hypothetical protein
MPPGLNIYGILEKALDRIEEHRSRFDLDELRSRMDQDHQDTGSLFDVAGKIIEQAHIGQEMSEFEELAWDLYLCDNNITPERAYERTRAFVEHRDKMRTAKGIGG